RLEGSDGTGAALQQLFGIARPAEGWERDILRPRVAGYDGDVITRLSAAGGMVWVGAAGRAAEGETPARTLATATFVRRGRARAWLGAPVEQATLGEGARRVLEALRQEGASFFDDIALATSLGGRQLRDALRELVGGGLVTSDAVESLRQVVRWRPLVS